MLNSTAFSHVLQARSDADTFLCPVAAADCVAWKVHLESVWKYLNYNALLILLIVVIKVDTDILPDRIFFVDLAYIVGGGGK